MSFKNMKLSTKLYAGFGILLLILAGVSALSWDSITTAEVGFDDYRGLARDTNLAGGLQAHMLELRLDVRQFVVDASKENLEKYRQTFKALNALLDKARQEIKIPKRAAMIKQVATQVLDYEKGFEQVVKAQAERERLVDEVLNVKGPEMERLLSKFMHSAHMDSDAQAAYYAGEALRSLLLAQLYAIKFLDDNSKESAQRVNKEYAAFSKGLEELGARVQNSERKAMIEEVAARDDVYFDAFGKLTATIWGRNEVIEKNLDVIGPKIAGLCEDVKLSVRDDQNELGARMSASNDLAVTTVLIVATSAILLGILMAFFITRSITKPINRVVAGLADGANQVASASSQVANSGQALAQGAAEQAASLEETSSSMEEMASMTRSNSENAGQADGMMQEASRVVEQANTSMSELRGAMEKINTASDETAKIIKTIDEIAFQTNLLALNAAVEAARAGEAGAGFAVVADEVRNLAMRAAEAAKNTSRLIEENIKDIKTGTDLVQTTDQAFQEVMASAGKVAELVAEIASASNEQTQGIEQVNQAMGEMDEVTQQNAANAEESAAAAEELSAQADTMQGYVDDLVALVGRARSGNGKRRSHAARIEHRPERRSRERAKGQEPENRALPKNPKQELPLEDADPDFKDF